MFFELGSSARRQRCGLLILGSACVLLCAGVAILVQIDSFATSVRKHTVAEQDLSIDYQYALNESLRTNPCCDAAKWSPSPSEVSKEQIPRIIHQTYKTQAIPAGDWQTAHDLCLAIHPAIDGWKHILWTDETAEAFIKDQFPDFSATFRNYPYPIQRVDAMRYFILYHYGGVYIDLDIGCARSMLSLLQFPAFFPKTRPLGVSNDLIGSRPGHPFMYALGEALHRQGSKKHYGTMYLTVFFTTGPMFVNKILRRYWQFPAEAIDKVFILPENFYSESLTAYFMHFPGSSWHGNDASGVIMLYTYGWIFLLLLAAIVLWQRMNRGYIRRARSHLKHFFNSSQ